MNKIFISGGCGYIGSVLVKKLLQNQDNKITILDNLMYNQLGLLHELSNPNLNLVIGDVRNEQLLSKLVKENDIIIPLAAIVGAPACDKYKQEATDINLGQIKTVIKYLHHSQKLIYCNSNSMYGSSSEIITEDSPCKALSHYAQTKYDAELQVRDYTNGVCFRLATVCGLSPKMRLDLLVNDFTYKSLTDGYLVLFEADFKRNYIHVDDVADTLIYAINNYDKLKNNSYNVGLSNANLSKRELAELIKIYIPNLVIKEEEFKKDKDQRNYIVSNKKLELTGWKPKKTIDDAIWELIQGYKLIINYNNKGFTNL